MLAIRREFEPRPDHASIFDTRGSENIVFGPFFRGGNSTNPVNLNSTQSFHLTVFPSLNLPPDIKLSELRILARFSSFDEQSFRPFQD